MNFYGRVTIFMKLSAHGPNRLTNPSRGQIMAKSIFTTESKFSSNWVLSAPIGSQGLPEVRSWQNQFLRPNRKLYEIGCSRTKSEQKRLPRSNHGKMNFYGRIAIFMKLGPRYTNRCRSPSKVRSCENEFFRNNHNFYEIGCSRPRSAHKRSPSSNHGKINFHG